MNCEIEENENGGMLGKMHTMTAGNEEKWYAWTNKRIGKGGKENIGQPCTKDKVQESNVNSDETEVAGRKIIDKEKWETLTDGHIVSVSVHNGMLTVYKVLKQCINWEGIKEMWQMPEE
jgi:hypothetical protein